MRPGAVAGASPGRPNTAGMACVLAALGRPEPLTECVAEETATETEIAPDRAAGLIEAGDAELIDVRRPYEWEAGRIEGARLIELNELTGEAESISRQKPVIFYCRSGSRSALAAAAFRQAGWDAYNLAGGLRAWVEHGCPSTPRTARSPSPGPAPRSPCAVHDFRSRGAGPSWPRSRRQARPPPRTPGRERGWRSLKRRRPPRRRADPQERIDGLRAWVAQVDRKLGVRTYVGAAIAVLALAAAAVGLVLTLSLEQDAANDSDVQSLRDQISAVEQSASQAAQEDVQTLDRRLTDLEAQVNSISTRQTTARRELKVVQDDIKELRSQVSRAGGSSGATRRLRRRPGARSLAHRYCDNSHEACLHASDESFTVAQASWGRRQVATTLRRTHAHTSVPERRSHRCQPVTA